MSNTPELIQRLPEPLRAALVTLNYHQFTPIQAASLPPMLDGQDVRAQAKTGSGKTAAFGLALLAKLSLERNALQGLVLCPTRELADQVAGELRRLGRALPNLKISAIYGGTAPAPQIASLRQHAPHVIVGTPGRVLDLTQKGHVQFAELSALVLDEADRLLEMGFIEQISALIERMPPSRNTWLFSATFPPAVAALSQHVQRSAVQIKIDIEHAPNAITQHFYALPDADAKTAAVAKLLMLHQAESALVFCNTKLDLERLLHGLEHAGIRALALHGDLEQRNRSEVLVQFNNGSARVLLATDVAARGLDIKALKLVISYELAFEPQMHTHRIGRTGRAGESGLALHLLAPRELPRLAALGERISALPELPASMEGFQPAKMRTLVIDGGKTDKLRAGDIVGALTGAMALAQAEIGQIEITPTRSYVAIARTAVDTTLKQLKHSGGSAKIKGRNFRARWL